MVYTHFFDWFQTLKTDIVKSIKNCHEMEKLLDDLDVRIGLLVQNRMYSEVKLSAFVTWKITIFYYVFVKIKTEGGTCCKWHCPSAEMNKNDPTKIFFLWLTSLWPEKRVSSTHSVSSLILSSSSKSEYIFWDTL